jgi:Txe/YoeB family toxin of toxin-antitoxin system
MWIVKFTKNAAKDKKFLKQSGLDKKAKKLLDILATNPYKNPPSYEKLIGDLNGYYSRRINIQHRLVYRIDETNKEIIIHSMWSHYE